MGLFYNRMSFVKCDGNVVVFLVLYADDIFGSWKQYQSVVRSKGMVVQIIRYEGLGRVRIYSRDQRDHNKRMLCLSRASYNPCSFSMQNSKKGFLPFRHGVALSKEMSPKTSKEIEEMKTVPYAIGSLMYAMHETRYLFCHEHG